MQHVLDMTNDTRRKMSFAAASRVRANRPDFCGLQLTTTTQQ
jgi:hypothetical protein